MVRPPCMHPGLFLLALTLFVSSHDGPAIGQSTAKVPYRLEVLSAEYLPETDTIQYKLINNGTCEINAYEVQISVLADGKEFGQTGTGALGISEDLLDPQLFEQCRNANGWTQGEALPGTDSREWSFKPGEIYVKSMPSNVDKSKLNAAPPQVRVSVTGIIWSDGKIEGTSSTAMSPLGLKDMNRIREYRLEEADFETKTLAIVDAHPEDPDIQHRIAEAIKGLQSLLQGYPREEATPDGGKRQVSAPPVVIGVIGNLGITANSPHPKEVFEAFSALWTCEHEHRVALLQQYTNQAAKSKD
jgi:hypothetical protein